MLFVHIGTHKTGTSALQTAMRMAEVELLANGARYIRAGREGANAHHNLPWSIRGKKGVPLSVWENVRAELAASDSAINILSSEGFWFADAREIRKELGACGDLRIVLYLRRQDRYLQSLYKQSLAGGRRSGDFESWLAQHGSRGDYLSVVRQWADEFGRDALVIRPYEHDGKRIDTRADFMRVVGLDSSLLSERARGMRNPSPRRELAELIRAFNEVEVAVDRQEFFMSIMKGKPQYARSADLLDYEGCRRVLSNYEESNRILRDEFYRDPGVPLFPELVPFDPPEFWDPDRPEYFDMVVDVMTAAARTVAGWHGDAEVADKPRNRRGKNPQDRGGRTLKSPKP